MFNKIKEIKRKIKLAKIWAIIFAVIFIILVLNNIYLTYKVISLQNQIENIWK